VDVVVLADDLLELELEEPLRGLDGVVGCCIGRESVGAAFAAGTTANVTAVAMLRLRFSTRASCRARSGTPAG
jgi:hypothetical protein